MKRTHITPCFVDVIPERLEDGVLYISERYRTALHKCCCGCSQEVVTPLSPADWQLTRQGGAVSLSPSIGNWSYRCRSHYWIRGNRVIWAAAMTDKQIAQVKAQDRAAIAAYAETRNQLKAPKKHPSIWSAIWSMIARWF